ncbi:MAG TPA: copper chaperone PCu(A)C [Micavibrio sp.]|nr:copper chaperone PCu(A)C [Micavibrio sp.]
MKRSYYLLPLMAVTALSLTLAACDDKEQEDTAATEQTTTTTTMEEQTPAPAVAATVDASNASAYATAEGARTGAVFVTLFNPQASVEKLLGVSSDKAPIVEIHQSYIDEADGTMQMRKVESVEILPSQQVQFKPGGYHIMLIDLAEPLVEGQTFNVVLKFQNAGDVSVPVIVTAPGATGTDATTTTVPAPTPNSAVYDDSGIAEPDTAADAPGTETPSSETTVDEAPPEPTALPADEPAVPADEPVTDAPATDEQPAQ